MNYQNISPDFKGSTRQDREIGKRLIELEETPKAIRYFAKHHSRLSNYAYWFYLSTLWVSYTGFSDLNLWRKLFSSHRPNRQTSIMKPLEFEIFQDLPDWLTGYRAHRPEETDWISYTLRPDIAARFARERQVSSIAVYQIPKEAVLAFFSRRGEWEILVLDKTQAIKEKEIKIHKNHAPITEQA
jgi:hypothetical protein